MKGAKASSVFVRSLALAALAFGTVALVRAVADPAAESRQGDAKPPDTIVVEKDLEYAKAGDKPLRLDLARPKEGEGPFPLIVCIHGGGWKAGSKEQMAPQTYALAQQGYVAATVQYRLVPEGEFPDPLQDVRAAIRFLKGKAKELRIDADRIGVLGGSAGGHLALLLGTADGKDIPAAGDDAAVSGAVRAVASIAGPTDLTKEFPEASEAMVRGLIGKGRDEDAEAYRAASPIRYVSKGDPAILAIHGTKDELVPYEQATSLIEACKKAGVDAELITIQDGGHGGGGKPEDWQEAILKLVRFFEEHLKR